MLPFFDSDTNMLYLGGKGDTNIRYNIYLYTYIYLCIHIYTVGNTVAIFWLWHQYSIFDGKGDTNIRYFASLSFFIYIFSKYIHIYTYTHMYTYSREQCCHFSTLTSICCISAAREIPTSVITYTCILMYTYIYSREQCCHLSTLTPIFYIRRQGRYKHPLLRIAVIFHLHIF